MANKVNKSQRKKVICKQTTKSLKTEIESGKHFCGNKIYTTFTRRANCYGFMSQKIEIITVASTREFCNLYGLRKQSKIKTVSFFFSRQTHFFVR